MAGRTQERLNRQEETIAMEDIHEGLLRIDAVDRRGGIGRLRIPMSPERGWGE
jgi:non-ribosomal peptide synthetase component E (peptide arylation enzyme)